MPVSLFHIYPSPLLGPVPWIQYSANSGSIPIIPLSSGTQFFNFFKKEEKKFKVNWGGAKLEKNISLHEFMFCIRGGTDDSEI